MNRVRTSTTQTPVRRRCRGRRRRDLVSVSLSCSLSMSDREATRVGSQRKPSHSPYLGRSSWFPQLHPPCHTYPQPPRGTRCPNLSSDGGPDSTVLRLLLGVFISSVPLTRWSPTVDGRRGLGPVSEGQTRTHTHLLLAQVAPLPHVVVNGVVTRKTTQ